MSRLSSPLLAVVLLVAAAVFTLALVPGAGPAWAASPITLIIDGQVVETDVPPRIVNDRAMVPVRVISERLGAQVEWDEKARQVHIAAGERQVVLTIGAAEARVGGSPASLDAAPFIEKGRAMVPLRFIGEALGARVGWDRDTRTVTVDAAGAGPGSGSGGTGLTGVAFDARAEAAVLTLQLSRPYEFKATALDPQGNHPARIMVDFPGAALAMDEGPVAVGQGGILRAIPEARPGGGVRVMVELDEAGPWKAVRAANGRDVEIRVGYKVTGVEYRTTPEGPALFIRSEGPLNPKTHRMTDPHRLVVDLPYRTVGTSVKSPMTVEGYPLVERIRIGQFDPDTVRVVVDMTRDAGFTPRPAEGGLALHLHGRLDQVDWELAGDTPRLILGGDLALGFRVRKEKEGRRVVVELPYTSLALPEGRREVGAGPIEAVTVSSKPEGNPHPTSFVTVELTGPADIQVVGGTGGLEPVPLPPPGPARGPGLKGRLIVVDPGHGGRDPGSTSVGGVHEKTLTLAIAQQLRDLLERGGARVVMTRTDDVYVDLYDRAGLANDVGADAFVSIHLNAFYHNQMEGTETYHHPKATGGRALAQAVHRAMLERVGRVDRGLRSADFVVLRETTMPAVLVEALYITHPEEERMALNPEVQRRIALAVYEGLDAFFAGGFNR